MPATPKTKPAAAKPAAKAKPAAAEPATAKAAAKRPAKAKPDAPAKPAKAAAKVNPAPAYRLKDLIDAVVAATGDKKPDVKRAVEATLDSLAAALKRSDDVNLPPLGRARVVKSTEKDGNATLTLKLRLGGGAKSGTKLALADDGEDS